MIETYEEILARNGFSPKEARVYLCVLEAGEIPISPIATRTRLKRSTVYSVVEALKARSIISIHKRQGIQYVSALSPRVLIDSFIKASEEAENILPELLKMAYSSSLKPRIRFFEGTNGIKQILSEFSHSKVPGMGFTDYEQMPPNLISYIRKEVVPKRKHNLNRARLLVPNNKTNRLIMAEDEKYFTQHRIVEFSIDKNPIELLIFGSSEIAFLSFTRKEMFGLIIDSVAIYKTLKNIFDFVWVNSEEK